MPRPPSDISQRIVHAARERFLTESVDGASLRNIAKDAKTSIGMIYYYFPTKDDLFLAVVQEVYVVLLGDVREALSGEGTAEEKLRRLYVRLGRMSDVEFTVIRLILREAMVSSARMTKLAGLFQRGHIPIALQTLLEGQSRGELRGELHPLFLAVATAALGVFPQIVRRRAGPLVPPGLVPSGEALAETMLSLLLHGIAAREPAAPARVPRKRVR